MGLLSYLPGTGFKLQFSRSLLVEELGLQASRLGKEQFLNRLKNSFME
jgi:hypothetical protein